MSRFSPTPAGSILVADCKITPAVVVRAAAAARSRGFRVVLDPAPAERAGPEMLRQCDALTPDAQEAGALAQTDTGTPMGAARPLQCWLASAWSWSASSLAMAAACSPMPGSYPCPPTDINVVDSTGAGDAFTGALAVALLEGQAPQAAALFATAASHLAVTAYGSQQAYPTREQIEALLPRLAAGTHELRA